MTPSIDINPAAGVLRQARNFPRNITLIYEGEQLDYAAPAVRIEEYARAFAASGGRSGDRTGYLRLKSNDVAVVGVDDSKWGESVVAVRSCKDRQVPTDDELREFTIKYLARYKLPKRLILTGNVPRNGSGKVDKPNIRLLVTNEA